MLWYNATMDQVWEGVPLYWRRVAKMTRFGARLLPFSALVKFFYTYDIDNHPFLLWLRS